MEISGEYGGQWTLLTGHGHVLVEIARNPLPGSVTSALSSAWPNAPCRPLWLT